MGYFLLRIFFSLPVLLLLALLAEVWGHMAAGHIGTGMEYVMISGSVKQRQ